MWCVLNKDPPPLFQRTDLIRIQRKQRKQRNLNWRAIHSAPMYNSLGCNVFLYFFVLFCTIHYLMHYLYHTTLHHMFLKLTVSKSFALHSVINNLTIWKSLYFVQRLQSSGDLYFTALNYRVALNYIYWNAPHCSDLLFPWNEKQIFYLSLKTS